jgi:hypothetical protein
MGTQSNGWHLLLGQIFRFGILVLGFSTVGLGIASIFLIRAIQSLARVLEQNWKSGLAVSLWIVVNEGRVAQESEAYFGLRAVGVVDVAGTVASIDPCIFISLDGEMQIAVRGQGRRIYIGDVPAQLNSGLWNIWEDLAQATTFCERNSNAVPEGVPGVRITVTYTHSISGHTYSASSQYSVSPSPPAAFFVRDISAQERPLIL